MLLLAVLGCGKAKPDPNTTVEVQPANLAGYWYASDQDEPVVLHFGAALIELPGETQTVEVAYGNTAAGAGTYALTGTHLAVKGAGSFSGDITRLTHDAMDVAQTGFQAIPLHFRRMEGCGGPNLWMGAAGRPVAAAWGDDGSLHLLSAGGAEIIGSETGQYSVVPPGRCAAVTPGEALTGNAIDIAPDGTVRILDVTGDGIFVRELPAQPWARDALNVKNTRLMDGDHSSIRPPSVVTHLPDGRTLLAWAHSSATYTWLSDGAGGYHAEVLGAETPTVTPQRLVTWPQPGGGVRVGPDWHSGWAYDGHAWTQVLDQTDPVVGLPIEHYGPDGLLYAVRSDAASGHYPSLIVGRRRADGTWQEVDVGLGFPVDLRVRSDGTVDVAFYYQPGKAAMGLLSVPASFDPIAYSQSYGVTDAIYNGFITIYDDDTNIYPFAAFGPDGAVLVSANQGAWRQPKWDVPGPHRPWAKAHVDFAGDAPATLKFPTLGLSCTATCDLLLPTREVVPATVETPDSSQPGWIAPPGLLVGGEAVGNGVFAVLTQHDPVTDHHDTYGTLTLAVHSSSRHLNPVVPLADGGLQDQLFALADAPSGGLLAWTGVTGLPAEIVALDAQLRIQSRAPVDTVTTPPQGQGRVLAARTGGGALLWVADFGGRGGTVLFLNAALQVEKTQILQSQDVVALTGAGAWVLRPVDQPFPPGGSLIDLVPLTVAGEGAPVHTTLPLADQAVPLGDGVLVSLTGNDQPGPGGVTLYNARQYLFRLGADGALKWMQDLSRNAAWTAAGNDVAVIIQYTEPLTFAGQTFAVEGPLVTDLAALLDGSTGTLTQSRTGVFSFATGVPLGADAQGVTTLVTNANSMSVTHVPFAATGAISQSRYDADGRCSDVRCRGGTAMVLPRSGAWLLGWNQGLPMTYDGFAVADQGVPLVGIWRP